MTARWVVIASLLLGPRAMADDEAPRRPDRPDDRTDAPPSASQAAPARRPDRPDDRTDAPPSASQAWHGSLSVGGSLLLTGENGDRTRFDASLSVQPPGRFGGVIAARAFDEDPRSVMLTGGLEYQAAAARPRLVLTLYVDAGIETSSTALVVGVGSRTTFAIIGPLGLVGDTGAHLQIDDDEVRLVIGSSLGIALIR